MDFQELGWDFYFKIKYLPFIQFIFLKLRLTFCHIVRKNTRTICAKRFPILLQTISQSPENDFRTYWHPSYGLCHAENRIKRRYGGVPDLYFPYLTYSRQFFARKGSHPSDLLCTNVLRWTFYLTIFHRDFTGKRVVRMKLFLTNLQLYWFSMRYGEWLDKGFFMSYICRWKT